MQLAIQIPTESPSSSRVFYYGVGVGTPGGGGSAYSASTIHSNSAGSTPPAPAFGATSGTASSSTRYHSNPASAAADLHHSPGDSHSWAAPKLQVDTWSSSPPPSSSSSTFTFSSPVFPQTSGTTAARTAPLVEMSVIEDEWSTGAYSPPFLDSNGAPCHPTSPATAGDHDRSAATSSPPFCPPSTPADLVSNNNSHCLHTNSPDNNNTDTANPCHTSSFSPTSTPFPGSLHFPMPPHQHQHQHQHQPQQQQQQQQQHPSSSSIASSSSAYLRRMSEPASVQHPYHLASSHHRRIPHHHPMPTNSPYPTDSSNEPSSPDYVDDAYGPSPPGSANSTSSNPQVLPLHHPQHQTQQPQQHHPQPSSQPSVNSPGGGSVSPTDPSKTYSFVSLPGTTVKKRPRRRYDEIERLYQCSWQDCTKAYGTLNHLNAHVTMQKHGPKRSPAEFKELRKQWRKSKKDADMVARSHILDDHSLVHHHSLSHPPPPSSLPDQFDYPHLPVPNLHQHHHPDLRLRYSSSSDDLTSEHRSRVFDRWHPTPPPPSYPQTGSAPSPASPLSAAPWPTQEQHHPHHRPGTSASSSISPPLRMPLAPPQHPMYVASSSYPSSAPAAHHSISPHYAPRLQSNRPSTAGSGGTPLIHQFPPYQHQPPPVLPPLNTSTGSGGSSTGPYQLEFDDAPRSAPPTAPASYIYRQYAD